MELENLRVEKIKNKIDCIINENINCTYDDFLVDSIMDVVRSEIIKAFNTGVSLGDTRNYLGEQYLNELCTK